MEFLAPMRTRFCEGMLRTRGYSSVKVRLLPGEGNVLIGREQAQPGHPRPAAECMVWVVDGTFKENTLTAMVEKAHREAVKNKLPPESSIVYSHHFEKGDLAEELAYEQKHEAKILSAYADILAAASPEHRYHLEIFQIGLFPIDWSLGRTTRDWRIAPEEDFVLLYNAEGAVLVDRPPMLSPKDPWVVYIGARCGDYVSWDRIESGAVGPIWSYAMAKVGRKFSDQSKANVEDEDEGEDDDDGED